MTFSTKHQQRNTHSGEFVMSDRYMEDSMEDLAYDEAEGATDGYEDEGDYGDADAGEGEDEFLRGILGGIGRVAGGLLGGGGGGGDGFEDAGDDEFDAAADGFEEGESEVSDYEAFEDAVADALESGDTDEFFGRIARIARNVGRTVGNVARTVAPIASAIPIPQAQAVGRVAGVLGRLLADGADEFEALEELFDYAETDDIDAAAPLIAGLTVRQRMPGVARAPRQLRRQMVRSVANATRTLARRQGPRAARAVPGVVQRVQQGVRRRALPPRRAATAIRRVAQRVARSPRAVQVLAQRARATAPAAARQARAAGIGTPGVGGAMGAPAGGFGPAAHGHAHGHAHRCAHCRRARTFSLRGPVQITIRGR
jgi:hypothetical protein